MFEKLRKRIFDDLGLELEIFERCYPGYWQRSNGAWSWRARTKTSPRDYGSSHSAAYLVKSKSKLILLSSGEIIPDE